MELSLALAAARHVKLFDTARFRIMAGKQPCGDSMIDVERPAYRWGIAALATVAAIALHWLAQPFSGAPSHLPFILAIGIVSVVGGRAQAALVLGTGLAVSVWRVVDGSSALPDSVGIRVTVFIGYLLLGTLIIILGDRARRQAQATRRASKAELDLRRSTQELRTLLDLIPAGVAIANDANADHITVSHRFARMLGISETTNASSTGDQRPELPYRCMRGGVEVPSEELPMQVAARTGREVHDTELDLVFPDGRIVHLLASAAPLYDADGRPRGAIGVHTDITALKNTQRELERMDRQKDIFLATLAHELRNPLAPIRYTAALLHKRPEPELIGEASRMIERQTAQMGRLLDELLDMSRVTRNVIELRREPVDLREVIREQVDALQPHLDEHSHTLEVRCVASAWVVGDETRLHQIVGNLLGNAAKYTPPGGRIELTLEAAGDELELRVRDNGIGISQEDLPHVFDLFTQARRPGIPPVSGLGIGLAVVRRLVQLHGGRIAVQSAGPGAGTEFIVHVPRAPEPVAGRAVQESAAEHPGRNRRVLVCDDNVDAADSLAGLLRLSGYSVRVAYDGSSALRTAEEFRPQVSVLDLGLPDMSGEEVALWIGQQPWAEAVTLIAVTGWGDRQDRERTAAAGFTHHLVKPVDPRALLELIGG